MITTIELKFNNLIDTIRVEEGSHLSLSDLISLASSSFGVTFEKVKVYQEVTDTGNLSLIDNNDVFNEILSSPINNCVIRLIPDGSVSKVKDDRQKKKLEKKNKKQKEKWIERKTRLAFECASKRLNEEHGTSITPEDLKIIFDRLDIHAFRLARCNLLPQGFFKKCHEEDEKINADDWLDIKPNELNSGNECQEAICSEFDRTLKIDDTSDSDDSSEDEKGGKKDKKKNKKDMKLKMMKQRCRMFEGNDLCIPPPPPIHPMMMHYPPMMFGLPPPPPPFHHRHHHHHHLHHKHHEQQDDESMHLPPFDFNHLPPHHHPHQFPFPPHHFHGFHGFHHRHSHPHDFHGHHDFHGPRDFHGPHRCHRHNYF